MVISILRVMATAAVAAMQPGVPPPVADVHDTTMSNRLFPLIEAIRTDRLSPAARQMLAERKTRIRACTLQDVPCVVRGALWTSGEIDILAAASAAREVVGEGAFLPDDGKAAQLKRELVGLNAILQVYGQGQPSRNPKVDGPIEKAGEAPFVARISTAADLARAGDVDAAIDPSVELAVSLLDVNDRDEAIAFEPLDARFNSAAKAFAATVDWKNYPYTSIIVLGNGPETDGEALSPRGKLRVKLAAARFAAGAAPFIIVSGGAVHPRGTHFAEAVEMRRTLVERYGIPERNIVVEPYARYTSTNLRNATRRLHAIGAPLNREAVVLTDPDHSVYVESRKFKDRSIAELGYFPGTIGTRLSSAELTVMPTAASLRIDPLDPLDP